MDALTMGLLIERLTEIRDDQRKLIRMLEENRKVGDEHQVRWLRRAIRQAERDNNEEMAEDYRKELAVYGASEWTP